MTSPDFWTDLGETFMRLGGDLARAEKQFRECLPSQYDRAREIMRQAADRWRDHIDSMIASQRRMVEIGTGSETSPDAGASIRDRREAEILFNRMMGAAEDFKYADGGSVEESAAWDKYQKMRAQILDALSVAKPAEASDAEQIPHPVAEAEQSPLPAGDGQAARLVSLMVDYLETDKIMSIPVPETSLGWLAAAKTWLAQAPTRTGKGE